MDLYNLTKEFKYDEDFLREHAKKHNVNLFNVINDDRNTIFHLHKYSEEFLKEHAERYNVNIFKVLNRQGDTIFHVRSCIEQGKCQCQCKC